MYGRDNRAVRGDYLESTDGQRFMFYGARKDAKPPAKDWGPGILTEKAQPDDPWQHRGKNMRCSTCMWFAVKAGHIGRCRRHAPTLNGYPVVYKSDWCGDHKLNEAT